MLRVIGAVPLFGCAFRLGLLVSVTVAFGCDGKPNTQLTPPSQFGPAISSITPATGSTSGATVVTIVGLRFQAGATVTFGGATATVSSLSMYVDYRDDRGPHSWHGRCGRDQSGRTSCHCGGAVHVYATAGRRLGLSAYWFHGRPHDGLGHRLGIPDRRDCDSRWSTSEHLSNSTGTLLSFTTRAHARRQRGCGRAQSRWPVGHPFRRLYVRGARDLRFQRRLVRLPRRRE